VAGGVQLFIKRVLIAYIGRLARVTMVLHYLVMIEKLAAAFLTKIDTF